MPRQGFQVAKTGAMESEQPVRIVKQYDRPDFATKPNRVDEKRAHKTELLFLRGKLAEQSDQIRRLKEEIMDEIKMLIAALEENEQETQGQVQRRISRLKGSLEYRGRPDFKERR